MANGVLDKKLGRTAEGNDWEGGWYRAAMDGQKDGDRMDGGTQIASSLEG